MTLVGALVLAAIPSGGAVAQSGSDCSAAIRAIKGETTAVGVRPCRTLATIIIAEADPIQAAADRLLADGGLNPAEVFGDREFQARHPQHASLSGTPAQSDAIPGVRPAALAAGSVAMVGSDAGDDAVAALAVNPSLLFLADHATEQLARLSRFMDLSIFVPVTSTDDDLESNAIDYLGVRLRMNVHGLSAGSQLWERADALLRDWITDSGRDLERVEALLAEAPALEQCSRALLADDQRSIRSYCGRSITFADREEGALRDQLDAIRREADSRYWGADIRLDWGDPTLGAVAGAAATSIFGGLSYGRRFDIRAGAGTYGFRARLGARHVTLEDGTARQLGVDGGFGFDLSRAIDAQEVSAAAALEGRWGGDDDGAAQRLQTNFAILRGSLVVPVTAGNSISLALGVPVAGDVSSFLTVNFNWGLLFPAAP